MIIDSLSNPNWRLTHPGGNTTDATLPARAPTMTPPDQLAIAGGIQAVGDGVIPCGSPRGEHCPQSLSLLPIAVGSSTNTALLQVIGWRGTRVLTSGAPGNSLWIPVELMTATITMGSAVGVAGSDIGSSTVFMTTAASVTGPQFKNVATTAPIMKDFSLVAASATSRIGMLTVGTLGFRFIEVVLATNSSVTSVNCLWCFFS